MILMVNGPPLPRQCILMQGWAGMTFGSSGTGTGMDNSIPEVREREGNWKNPFPQFGNGKGMKKNHSQNSGMGREWKNLFPKFGNGKGMKKIHSHNSGTGREWKKPIPIIREREGNEKKAFPKFGNGKGMKKSIPIIRERESEAFILGNGQEREFPLTPVQQQHQENRQTNIFWSTNSKFLGIFYFLSVDWRKA